MKTADFGHHLMYEPACLFGPSLLFGTLEKTKEFCKTEKYAIVIKQENNGKSVKSFRDNEV